MKEKVSVIIPNYNNEKYLKQCIDSVLNQTWKNIEVIIIDDGSTDQSKKIIEEYAKLNSKIIAIFQKNMNAAIARNRGLEIANGKYVLFLDSDDMLYENSIENMVLSIEDNDLIMGNYSIIDENNITIKEYNILDNLINYDKNYKYCNVSPVPSNKLFRMSVIVKNNLSFANVKIGQDLNFYLKYLACSENVVIIKERIYMYRMVSTGMTKSINLNFLDIYNSIQDVKKFYYINNLSKEYNNYLTLVELRHYTNQIERVNKFNHRYEKKMIYKYFNFCIKNAIHKKMDSLCKKQLKKYYIKCFLLKFGILKS